MARKDVSDVQVLLAMKRAKEEGFARWPYDILAEETGQPWKVCWRAMERASDRGLLNYGVSLRTGWVTEKGEALLDRLVYEPVTTRTEDVA